MTTSAPQTTAAGLTSSSRLLGPSLPTRRFDSLLSAIEAGGLEGRASVTFHSGGEAEHFDRQGMLDCIHRWSAFLHARGVRRGDRVPLLLPTGPSFLGAFVGAMRLGAVPVPLAVPMTFGSTEKYAQNLASILENSGATHAVCGRRMGDSLAKCVSATSSLRHVLLDSELPGSLLHSLPSVSLDAEDCAFLQYTSGTTGSPKGVVVSHRAMMANASAIIAATAITPEDVGVSWLPLFHDMGLIGMLVVPVCYGGPVHLLPPEAFLMRPARWLRLMSEQRATMTAGPNFAFDFCTQRVRETADLHLHSWRVALNGAEPVHLPTMARFSERFEAVGFRRSALLAVYGLAESVLAVTIPPLDDGLHVTRVDAIRLANGFAEATTSASGGQDLVGVGVAVAGSEVSIQSDVGEVLPAGRVGEICVRGASRTSGYYRNDDASAAAMRGDWLRTGDLGFVMDGRLFVSGRAKEIIIQGGRKYHPADMERIAATVSGVRAGGVAAFSVPRADQPGEKVVLVVETAERDVDTQEATARSLKGELLAALGVATDEVMFWAQGALPRTTSGKVRRSECARIVLERDDPAR